MSAYDRILHYVSAYYLQPGQIPAADQLSPGDRAAGLAGRPPTVLWRIWGPGASDPTATPATAAGRDQPAHSVHDVMARCGGLWQPQ